MALYAASKAFMAFSRRSVSSSISLSSYWLRYLLAAVRAFSLASFISSSVSSMPSLCASATGTTEFTSISIIIWRPSFAVSELLVSMMPYCA